MANRLRATARPLIGTARARIAVTPAALVQTQPLLGRAGALLRLPVSLHATGLPLLGAAQVRLSVLVPTVRATGHPLLGNAQARLTTVTTGAGLGALLLGDPLGYGWPHYARGRAEGIMSTAQGQGGMIATGSGRDAGLAPAAAQGQGRILGDAWLDWFERWFAEV